MLESPCVEEGTGLPCTEEGFTEAASLETTGKDCELLGIAEKGGVEPCIDDMVGGAEEGIGQGETGDAEGVGPGATGIPECCGAPPLRLSQ